MQSTHHAAGKPEAETVLFRRVPFPLVEQAQAGTDQKNGSHNNLCPLRQSL
jgi:hypothetical protein